MNQLIKLASLGLVASSMFMVSCSDDDGPKGPVEPSVDNVFSQGLPASVDGATFTTNEKGQLTKITDGNDVITFEYGTFSRATQFNALMKVRDSEYPQEGSDFYMQLNDKGFVTYAVQVYLDGSDDDTWKFEYNSDGQLTRLQRSEGGDDFKITYVNGDITKVAQDEEDGDHREYTFSYVNTEFKTPVANKANLMVFDDFFHIDMDEMGVAYYAGLLGKSTKNLPMGYDEKGVEGGSSYTYSGVYHWTFNADKLPVKFWENEQEFDAITFSWK